jgi:hypothetical protein
VPCPTKNNRNLHILSESKGKEFAPRDADCTTSGWGILESGLECQLVMMNDNVW